MIPHREERVRTTGRDDENYACEPEGSPGLDLEEATLQELGHPADVAAKCFP